MAAARSLAASSSEVFSPLNRCVKVTPTEPEAATNHPQDVQMPQSFGVVSACATVNEQDSRAVFVFRQIRRTINIHQQVRIVGLCVLQVRFERTPRSDDRQNWEDADEFDERAAN